MTVTVYTDIALHAPLDDYLEPDVGDENSAKFSEPQKVTLTESRRLAGKKNLLAHNLIVPFTREIKLGSYGLDVVGAKRAIWRANDLGKLGGLTRIFGPVAVRQLKAFQRRHGLTPDGVLGPSTLKKLAPFFDDYAFLLYEGYRKGASPRDRICAYATWGVNHRDEIHYAEFRPMTGMNDLLALPMVEDCSTFATKAYKYAGCPDPNRMAYDGYGNTGSMRASGTWIPLAQALPGDLAHYDGPQHVGIYIGNGRVISHGSEVGPLLTSVYYRPLTGIQRYPL